MESEVTVIVAATTMSDADFIRHLELRHAPDLRLTWSVEPGRTEKRIAKSNRGIWETYHNLLHRVEREHEHE